MAPIIALANVVTFGQAMNAKARLSSQGRERDRDFSTPRKTFFSLLRLGHPYFVALCFLASAALIMIAATSLWQEKDAWAGFWTIVLLTATLILLFILGVCSASFDRKLEDWKIAQGRH